MALQEEFEQAAVEAKSLNQKPSNDNLLKLYAFFKQATEGNVSGERPGLLDFVGGAKYDAWEQLKGLASDEAMSSYVKLVDSLKD